MSQSVSTKEKLVNSAIKIFAEKGFWKAKVSDIVKEAGVAQGTFYIYFKSKNDCFKEILLILHNNTVNILKNSLIQNPSLSETIKIFIERIYQYKNISKVFLFEAISSGNDFQSLYFEFKNNFKNIFDKLITEPFKETKHTIVAGFLRELIEHDIIYMNKPLNYIFEKIDKFVSILNGEKNVEKF